MRTIWGCIMCLIRRDTGFILMIRMRCIPGIVPKAVLYLFHHSFIIKLFTTYELQMKQHNDVIQFLVLKVQNLNRIFVNVIKLLRIVWYIGNLVWKCTKDSLRNHLVSVLQTHELRYNCQKRNFLLPNIRK